MRLLYLFNQVPKRTRRSCLLLLAFQRIPPKTSRRSWFRKNSLKEQRFILAQKFRDGQQSFNRICPYKNLLWRSYLLPLHGMFRNCFFPSRAPLAKYTMSLETPPILPRLWRKIREAPQTHSSMHPLRIVSRKTSAKIICFSDRMNKNHEAF